MTTVTISLPESLKEFIDRQLATKGYGNVSEYFRSLLRDAQQVEADARLEALLLEGLASGDDVPLTRAFWTELKTEARQIAAKHNIAKEAIVNSVIRPRARDDIIRQFRWYLVEQDTSDAAFCFVDAVEESVEQLVNMPNMGTPREIRNPALKGLRVWPVKDFDELRRVTRTGCLPSRSITGNRSTA